MSDSIVENNKARFIELVNSITRENFDKEKLINKLENSDFFEAPASIKYHCAFNGGLCEHSLNVYDNLVRLVYLKYPDIVSNDVDGECTVTETKPWTDDTLKIVSLFHDISKMNYYEKTFRNKKVYCETGSKSDENGNYDWVTVPEYKTRESKDRFIYGNHETTAEFMLRCFIPLSIEESVAILHHMSGMGFDSSQENITEIYNSYSLACLLHMADLMSCYIDERI